MAKRWWCPGDWLDEVCPVQVEDPAHAVICDGEGRWFLVDDDFRDAGETDPSATETQAMPLEPGDVVIWSYSETRGEFTVTVDADGSFTLDGVAPSDATQWWVPGEHDVLADTLGELVRERGLSAGVHLVEARHWSNDVALRFDVEDGAPWFTECAGVN
ncbi:hypothetical protein [Aureimonas sp. AU12]|uniref:hypothetical protein n=1 Tax=Aureimonas sp. AU12 TaxID=1638161 RepID=UPI000782F489|nr:hypothetical protein [Aureimonas sp. AU12]